MDQVLRGTVAEVVGPSSSCRSRHAAPSLLWDSTSTSRSSLRQRGPATRRADAQLVTSVPWRPWWPPWATPRLGLRPVGCLDLDEDPTAVEGVGHDPPQRRPDRGVQERAGDHAAPWGDVGYQRVAVVAE